MSERAQENELDVANLIATNTLQIRDVRCNGACKHRSSTECAAALHFVFPYSGVFVRHVGSNETIADANQLVFFNEDEEYQISHPVAGADACLSVSLDAAWLRELAPPDQLGKGTLARFVHQARNIEPKTQAIAALLRHRLSRGGMEPMEAETLALALIQRALGERTSRARATTYGRAKLVDRTKLVLMSDSSRRWTLSALAELVGVSPVYLTQVFARTEGISLYRYQTRLRLGRALNLLGQYTDLTMLALELGFSSHSHFSSAFRKLYGASPTDFRRSAGLR